MVEESGNPLTGVPSSPPLRKWTVDIPYPPSLKHYYCFSKGGIQRLTERGVHHRKRAIPILHSFRKNKGIIAPLTCVVGVHLDLYLPGPQYGTNISDYEKIVHRLLHFSEVIQNIKLIRETSARFIKKHKYNRPLIRVRIEELPC